jgi:hypothetical protein
MNHMKSLIRATICAASLMSAQAASLIFERSQTLNGLHERAHTDKVFGVVCMGGGPPLGEPLQQGRPARHSVPDRPMNLRMPASQSRPDSLRSGYMLFQRSSPGKWFSSSPPRKDGFEFLSCFLKHAADLAVS